MAGGKKIYIGEMLEGMQDSMSSLEKVSTESAIMQANKLNEVVDVLSSILTSTGLTKQQKVYSGSDLTSVGITSTSWYELWSGNNSYITAPNIIKGDKDNKFHCMFNFTNIKTVKVSLYFSHGSLTTGRFAGTLKCAGISEVFELSTQSSSTTNYEFDVSDKVGLHEFSFAYNTSVGNAQVGTFTLTFIDVDENEITDIFHKYDGNLNYTDNVLTCSGANGHGYMPFSFTGVAAWSDIYIMGKLEGAKIYVISEYGIDLYSEMVAEHVIDISMINELKFYLLFELVEGNTISSISFRYF